MSLVAPMLAKAVDKLPEGEMLYEPKWDGFRGIVSFDGTHGEGAVQIGSRGDKPLTRYFPELVDAFDRLLPQACVLDGEIVVTIEWDGKRRLHWDSLTQRIHPAASRVDKLRLRLLPRSSPSICSRSATAISPASPSPCGGQNSRSCSPTFPLPCT